MGSGTSSSQNHVECQLKPNQDLAQITFFANQVKQMKFANQKEVFESKTKQTKNAINDAILQLKKDKLLDTGQIKNWDKKVVLNRKNDKNDSKGRVKTQKNQQTLPPINKSQSQKKMLMGQFAKRYTNRQSKAKSNLQLQYYSTANNLLKQKQLNSIRHSSHMMQYPDLQQQNI